MNLGKNCVGVLLTPTTPLWTGTVVSYTADGMTFTLEITPKTGLSAALVDWFVDAAGKFVRIRDVDTSGANALLTLAVNSVSGAAGGGFAVGAPVSIYNVIYPAPRYQHVANNVVTVVGGGAGQFTGWRFTNTGGYTTLWWEIRPDGRLIFYNSSGMEDDSKVAAGHTWGLGTISMEQRNNSKINCVVTVNSLTPTSGSLTITPYVLFKDWDITWESLGADDNARDKAAQGPVIIVNPEAACLAVGEQHTFSATGSFATYDGSNVPYTERYPATIYDTDYVWDPGAGGTVVSGQNNPTAVISWSTAGFRYLTVTVEDSNHTERHRRVPVWVGITPYPVEEKVTILWRRNEDAALELSFKTSPPVMRHSLVCLVDLDTNECLYLGYVWPASVEYDYEKSTLTLTAYQAITFLKQVCYYAFILTGVKGDPISWDYSGMLTQPRAVYFLLGWHSNYLIIANAQFDVRVDAGPPASPPGALAAENRHRYIEGFTAGTLYDQLQTIAKESFFSIYPLPLGGFEAIPDLLFGSAITGVIAETGVDSDTITLDLTAPGMIVPVKFDKAAPTCSEVTMWGFYHDADLDVFEKKVKAPRYAESYGRPAEVPNLLASPTNAPGDPGYYEMLRWAGRYIAVANDSDPYTIESMINLDLKIYKMADIPDPNSPESSIRLVVTEKALELNSKGFARQVLTGQTFGNTADSVVQPINPTPTTPPTIPPVPEPEPPETMDLTVLMTKNQIAASVNARASDSPTWYDLDPDGDLDTAGSFLHGGVTSAGEVWLATYRADNLSLCGLWYLPSALGSTFSWTLVKSLGQIWDDIVALGGTPGSIEIESFHCSSYGISAPITEGIAQPAWRCYAYVTGTHEGIVTSIGMWGDEGGSSRTFTSGQFNCGPFYVGGGESGDNGGLFGTLGGGYTKFPPGEPTGPRWTFVCGNQYAGCANNITDSGIIFLYSNWDGGENLYADMDLHGPLVEKSGKLFWVGKSTGYLMMGSGIEGDQVTFAIPNDGGPTDGVFSTAGAIGGAFICLDDYDEIFWVAHTPAAANSKRSIAYYDGEWHTRDGNWESVMGAWAGGQGDPQMTPMVMHAQVLA